MSDAFSELRDTVLEFRDRVVDDLTTLRSDVRALDDKVGALDTKVGALDDKVGALDDKVGALDDKVGALDDKVGALDDRVGTMHIGLDAVGDRVEGLRRTLLEFRTSVSQELGATSRRIDVLRDDITAHIRSSETAILNTIRDLSHETDRRTTWLEGRMAELEQRVDDRPSS